MHTLRDTHHSQVRCAQLRAKPIIKMSYESPNSKFLLTNDFGVVLGAFPGNYPHKHYTIQLTTSDSPFIVGTENNKMKSDTCIIASNLNHKVEANEGQELMILNVNPFSEFGLWCKVQLGDKDLIEANEDLKRYLRKEIYLLRNGNVHTKDLENSLNFFLADQCFNQEIQIDPRILTSLRQIRSSECMPSAKKMAYELNISESRFLHLFKTETGLTYRRMKLWFCIEKSFKNFTKVNSLTELAHLSGFSDSAHYSRIFKESF